MSSASFETTSTAYLDMTCSALPITQIQLTFASIASLVRKGLTPLRCAVFSTTSVIPVCIVYGHLENCMHAMIHVVDGTDGAT